VIQASSDPIQRQGPPARRANEGLDAHRANHVTCAAETGHMDARAEPMSVWGSDTWGSRRSLEPECGEACFAAGAAEGRSHTETQAGTVKPRAGQQEKGRARRAEGVLSALLTRAAQW